MSDDNSCCEISIKLSNEEQTFTQKFLCYAHPSLRLDDPILKEYVAKSKEAFKGVAEDIVVKVKMQWD